MATTDTVLLATTDHDLGLVPARTARSEAQSIADSERCTVTVRDATTDRVLATVRPRKR